MSPLEKTAHTQPYLAVIAYNSLHFPVLIKRGKPKVTNVCIDRDRLLAFELQRLKR